MTITTKFSVDEFVYFMLNNAVHSAKVYAIVTSNYVDGANVTYYAHDAKTNLFRLNEKDCHKGKNDLIKTL